MGALRVAQLGGEVRGESKLLVLSAIGHNFTTMERRSFDGIVTKLVKDRALFNALAELGQTAATAPAVRPASDARPHGLHVLLVDDNAVNQKLGERQLTRLGMRVTQAGDGRAMPHRRHGRLPTQTAGQ